MCSKVEGVQYSGGYSVQWRDIINTVNGFQYSEGISSIQWRVFSTVLYGASTDCTVLMISLHRTEYPPLYWWYSSTVLMISLHCTQYPPPYWWYPPPYWWYPSTVLNILHCTAHPPLYYITAHTLLGVTYNTWRNSKIFFLPYFYQSLTYLKGKRIRRSLNWQRISLRKESILFFATLGWCHRVVKVVGSNLDGTSSHTSLQSTQLSILPGSVNEYACYSF